MVVVDRWVKNIALVQLMIKAPPDWRGVPAFSACVLHVFICQVFNGSHYYQLVSADRSDSVGARSQGENHNFLTRRAGDISRMCTECATRQCAASLAGARPGLVR